MADIECIRCQNDEFKALTCIYLDELHPIREVHPQKFTIDCLPYSSIQSEYQINILFEFTSNYPKTPLKYELEPVMGITRDNVTAITLIIEEIIYNNRNRPLVYEIVEEARVWIYEYLVEGRAYKSEEELREKKEEIFERPKFTAFTPVTVESFTNWKKEFDAKSKQQKEILKIEKKEGEPKITGKQWFLGRKHEDIEEEEEDEDDEDFEDEEEEAEDEEKVIIPAPEDEKNDLFEN